MARTKNSKGITLSTNASTFEQDEAALKAAPVSEAPAVETPAPALQSEAPAEEKKIETVKLVLPAGTKETKLYLITPKMGKRERWFEKKRLTSYAKVGSSWEITLPTRSVKDRGILDMAVAH